MKDKWFFSIYLFIIVALAFIFVYYDKTYFLQFTANKQTLQLSHKIFYWSFKGIIILVMVLMLSFYSYFIKNKPAFFITLLTILIFFAALELGLRVYACNFSSEEFKAKVLFPEECGRKILFKPHHYLDYKGKENYNYEDNIQNSLGFRGEELRNSSFRIVVMGGSTTYDSAIKNWKDTFVHILENKLKLETGKDIEVINAGVGGYSSWETLISLEFVILELNPDLVIIHDGANDINARLVNPSLYKSDNSGMRKPWSYPDVPLLFKSMFIRALIRSTPVTLFDIVDNKNSGAGIQSSGYVDILNGTLMETLERNKPVYFERNLKNIVAITNENRIKTMFVTMALDENMEGFFQNLPHYQSALKENNKVIEKVAKEKGVLFYDFASEMPDDNSLFADGVHVNEKGAEVKAELFKKYILKNVKLDK